MTLLYATDLHGSKHSYERLLQESVLHHAGAIVLGGDLLPYADPQGQLAFLHGWLRPMLQEFLKDRTAPRIFGLLGNDDWIAAEIEFNALEKAGLLFGLHRRAHALDGELHIAGCSYVPITPFGISDFDRIDAHGWTPPPKHIGPIFSDTGRKVSGSMATLLARPTISETLAELAAKSPPVRTVYVLHAPPAKTNLDMLFNREHIGSGAVRKFIEQWQPPVTLHGHIHESRQVSGSISDRIGRTWSLNPGDSKEALNSVLIELDGGRVAWKELT